MVYTSKIKKVILYVLLITGAILMLVPFYWMITLSTHSTTEIISFPPPLIFGDQAIVNYNSLLEAIPFFKNLWNSLLSAGSHTILVILFCSLGGYAFAMYEFPGKNILFAGCLATMMIPWMAGMVPWFMIMREFGWIDNLLAIIVPGSANAFGIFWMRQYISSLISQEMLDAARIDGCPEWQIFFRIVFPVLTPATSALGIFSFVQSWNNFLVPLLVLNSPETLTLPVALNKLQGDPTRGFDMGVLLMGTTLAVIPLLLVFLLASRKFIDGMTAGAMKG